MSKFVKGLVTDDLKRRFDGVKDCLLVNISGLNAEQNYLFRKELRNKSMTCLVVKNSLARRAAEGTSLAGGFEGLSGQTAVLFGGSDVVALAKEYVRLAAEKQFAKLTAHGAVVDGARLAADEIETVSKWPTREEQLSLLIGQILSPGANLVGQLLGIGSTLAGQIKQKAEGEDAPASA